MEAGHEAAGDPTSGAGSNADSSLQMAQPKPTAFKMPEKFPDQPWKKKAPATRKSADALNAFPLASFTSSYGIAGQRR